MKDKKTTGLSIVLVLVMLLLAVLTSGCGPQSATDEKTKEEEPVAKKPVIVITAFGTSMEKGQANLNDFDKMVRARFPEHDVRWAFTAGFIIKKLNEAGITALFDSQTPIKSLDEVYEDLRAEGKTNVVVQIAMVMPGEEMRQALSYRTDGLNVKFGYPLLFSPENMQNVANALSSEFGGPGTATILVSHGNEKHPEFNSALIQMDKYLRENYDNVYLGTVEGPPGPEPAINDTLGSGATSVKFVPLMMVEGDHITNDIMGDEPDSWKSMLGLPATNATGLASNAEVMEIFLKNIENLLSQF